MDERLEPEPAASPAPTPQAHGLAPGSGEGPSRAAAMRRADRLLDEGGSHEDVRLLCLFAIGVEPRDLAFRETACARLERAGLEALAGRLRAGAPLASDLLGIAPPSGAIERLFEPSEGYARERLRTAEEAAPLAADTHLFGDVAVRPSRWVDKFQGIVERPRTWESAVVDEARVYYRKGLFVVLDADGRPLEAMSHPDYRLLCLDGAFRRFVAEPERAPRVERALYVQDHIASANYCHWLLDTVPRMRLREADDHVLLREGETGFVRETLAAIGVPLDRLVELDHHNAVRVGRLKVESSVARDFHHPVQKGCPALVEYVRALFADPVDVATHGRIYLSRNRSARRRIANEEELLPILEAEGFVTVHAEDHTLAEQARIFRDAEVVVAPHGAGLSNLVFSRPGTTVLELFDPNYGTASFYVLAKRIGLDYVSMECSGETADAVEQQRRKADYQRTDISVDAAQFGAALRALLAHRRAVPRAA